MSRPRYAAACWGSRQRCAHAVAAGGGGRWAAGRKEDRRLIGTLTVEDNILLPAWASRLAHGETRLAYIYDKLPDVAALAWRRASALSGGQPKMVALARALMSGTRLLLLDEPFEGLSPAMGEKLTSAIQDLQRDDLSVLIAESDLKRFSFAE
jgi:branched-chain amino acid transport system ATP-binding protein